MSRNEERRFLVLEAEATRDYGTTVLKAARHQHYASKEITAAALADELGERPDVEVLALLESDHRPVGLITREGLFA